MLTSAYYDKLYDTLFIARSLPLLCIRVAAMSKRAAEGEAQAEPLPRGGEDTLQITPLGAGSEVGRSCILLAYKGKNVMLDCGIHPGLSGMASLPYFDEVDLSTVRVRRCSGRAGGP